MSKKTSACGWGTKWSNPQIYLHWIRGLDVICYGSVWFAHQVFLWLELDHRLMEIVESLRGGASWKVVKSLRLSILGDLILWPFPHLITSSFVSIPCSDLSRSSPPRSQADGTTWYWAFSPPNCKLHKALLSMSFWNFVTTTESKHITPVVGEALTDFSQRSYISFVLKFQFPTVALKKMKWAQNEGKLSRSCAKLHLARRKMMKVLINAVGWDKNETEYKATS